MKIPYTFTLVLVLIACPILYTVAECSSWNASQARMRKAARYESQKIADFWKKFDIEINQAEDNLTISIQKNLSRRGYEE